MNETLAPRILVVTDDADLQLALRSLLAEEGYEPRLALGLAQGLAAVEAEPFDLALAELYVGRHTHSLAPAHILRRRVRPTPLGVLTTQTVSATEAASAGFAFVLPMPFDVESLLATVAATLGQSFSPEQEQRAQVVRDFFAALQAQDWMSALALCTDEITYYPARSSPLTTERRLHGKAAYAAYLARSARQYTVPRFPELRLYRSSKGLVARYLCCWTTPDGLPVRSMGTTLLHFDGERIAQIGVRLHAVAPQPTHAPTNAPRVG